MSYLELPGGLPDFSKAVISFWFRVPQASLAAAKAQYDAAQDVFNVNLSGVAPLLTFGPNEIVIVYTSHDGGVTFEETGRSLTSPCLIGVRYDPMVSSDTVDGYVLQVRLQYFSGDLGPPTEPGDLTIAGPDYFQIGGWMDGSVITTSPLFEFKPIMVAPDKWHHVIISFDMTGGCATSSNDDPLVVVNFDRVCKFWWAYDDVNYDGYPNCAANFAPTTGDKNGIVSNYCMGLVGTHTTRSFAAGNIPTSTKPVGTPARTEDVAYVYPVELAELQMFTGVTLDTSVTTNRRAFISVDGKPVDPTPTLDDPSDPHSPKHSPAERLLGQKPEILLHGSGNWIKGINTGPEFVPDPDSPDPDHPRMIPDPEAALTPTGKIGSYIPDPSLHGPQGNGAPARLGIV